MANVVDYMEEIFERKEFELSDLRTKEQITAFLISDGKGNIIRKQSRIIRQISEGLSKPYEIEDEASTTNSLEKLNELKREAEFLPIRRKDTVDFVDKRIIEVEEIAIKNVNKRIDETDNLNDLPDIDEETKTFSPETKKKLSESIKIRERELLKDFQEQTKEERGEVINRFRRAETIEERTRAEEELEELNRRSLGQVKRWERWRGERVLSRIDFM